jgi:hypothetical protein
MAAPKGNKNALGNKGGRPATNSTSYRNRVVKFRGLVVEEMEAVLKNGPEDKKFDLIKRMGPYCIPRDIQLSGDPDNPIRTLIVEKMKEQKE